MIDNKLTTLLDEYITVTKAASLVGVCKGTIRRWSDDNKISSVRHPLNNYRLFKKSDIERVLWELVKEKK